MRVRSRVAKLIASLSGTVDPPQPVRSWSVPAGQRLYAVGDIHGRLDLLCRLIETIERDDAARGAAGTTLVFVGDLVDRGPDSRGVLDFLIQLRASGVDCIFISGNHDDVFLRAVQGDREAAATLHRMGGRPTALSYGISREEYEAGSYGDLAALLRQRVPPGHVAFLRSFREWWQAGDYIFVHAGVRPGRPMEEQAPADLRWIRAGFLDWESCHGAMIVHGHTVTDEPDIRANRIGIDTGAFRSDKLTALGLEGEERWFLST